MDAQTQQADKREGGAMSTGSADSEANTLNSGPATDRMTASQRCPRTSLWDL